VEKTLLMEDIYGSDKKHSGGKDKRKSQFHSSRTNRDNTKRRLQYGPSSVFVSNENFNRTYTNFVSASRQSSKDKILSNDPTLSGIDLNNLVMQEIGQKWRNLSEAQKARYKERNLNLNDKARAYASYVQLMVQKVKKEILSSNPFLSGKKLNDRVTSEIGELWHELPEEEKTKFCKDLTLNETKEQAQANEIKARTYANFVAVIRQDIKNKILASEPFLAGKDLNDRVTFEIGVKWRSLSKGEKARYSGKFQLSERHLRHLEGEKARNSGSCRPPERHCHVSPKSVSTWADCKGRLAGCTRAVHVNGNAHIFIDVSNVIWGSQIVKMHGGQRVRDVRIQVVVPIMLDLIESRRAVATRIAVGSHSSESDKRWLDIWQTEGYNTTTLRRDLNNQECGVDEFIHAQISRVLLRKHRVRQTLVLVSGDGNTNGGLSNFPELLEAALRMGWNVELWSWKSSVNAVYRKFALAYPQQFQLRLLDNHRHSITRLRF